MKHIRKIAQLALFVIIILSVLSFGAYNILDNWSNTPGPTNTHSNLTDLIIEKGSSGEQIAKLLYNKNLISSSFKFYNYLRFLTNQAESLKSGYYQIPTRATPKEIIYLLEHTLQKRYLFTIPEGSNQEEIIDIISQTGLASKDSLEKAIQNPVLLKDLQISADIGGGAEGYFFPETYQFPAGTLPLEIFRNMHEELLKNISPEIKSRMLTKKLSLHEVLTLASLVEEETSSKKERPIIASVFKNRLKRGMKLQTDPSAIYGQKNHSGKIKHQDVIKNHKYNTYIHKGLPPGPISSPGLASIKAVLWPSQTNYLYFVSKRNGTHEFCASYSCHRRAINTWLKRKPI